MRIGIDARFYGGEQSKGLGRYTQKLIEYLAKIDTTNEYVVFLQTEEYRKWPIKNKNFFPLRAPYRWYSLSEQILMPIKIKQANVDFIHFPHFNVPLFYRGPFIVTIHDLILSRYPTERATTLGPWLYKIKQLAYHQVIKHAALNSLNIITVSKYSKKDIVDYFKINGEKIFITYEGTDLIKKDILDEEQEKRIINKYGIHRPFILYVGNAYPHKNLETLLQVVKKLKKQNKLDWKLVLIGKKDYFYKRLEQQAWAMDIDKEVLFIGFVSDRELPFFYKKALAYIFPSRYEGFGLPPLEAMSYHTPVVSSNQACLPEILGDAALYFDYQDNYGIINQLEKVIKNPEIRDELIKKGAKQIKKYSWEKMAQQTFTIYEQTAAILKNK